MKQCRNLPAHMEIDYVRLYQVHSLPLSVCVGVDVLIATSSSLLPQDQEDPLHTLSCSPEGFPTAQFIADFSSRYADWQPAVQPAAATVDTDDFTALILVICSVGHTRQSLPPSL
jgi:hypothetical protein